MEVEHYFASLKAVRFLVRSIIKINNRVLNILSLLKFKSLVKYCGRGSYFNLKVEIKHGENIKIGNNTTIGPYVCLGAHSSISIGNNCRISRGVIIETAGLNLSTPLPYKHYSKPIEIKDGVWIASNAIILGGVTIGENSIIGAGTIVTKNVIPNTVLVGVTGREIKR